MTSRIRYGLLVAIQLFLYACIFFGCRARSDTNADSLVLVWEDGRAVGLAIPREALDGVPADSLQTNVGVKLANHGDQPFMAGELIQKEGQFRFSPLIPFTRGLRYSIYIKHQLITEIVINRKKK